VAETGREAREDDKEEKRVEAATHKNVLTRISLKNFTRDGDEPCGHCVAPSLPPPSIVCANTSPKLLPLSPLSLAQRTTMARAARAPAAAATAILLALLGLETSSSGA
jgi:hypothetical protein